MSNARHAVATLIDLYPPFELLVFVADELDQLLVDQNALIDAHGERFLVSLRVVDRHVDLQFPEHWAAEAFGDLHLLAVRAAAQVEPSVEWPVLGSAEVVRIDDERVA